jgi:neuropeptide S receptor
MMNITSTLKLTDRQWPMDKIVRIFIISGIMCLTLIGNVYILIELCIRRQRQRTRLHYFIVNLAIGDLTIFACTMTSEMFLLIYDQEWILGNVACKLTLYVQVVTIASTTFINVAMTYDR